MSLLTTFSATISYFPFILITQIHHKKSVEITQSAYVPDDPGFISRQKASGA